MSKRLSPEVNTDAAQATFGDRVMISGPKLRAALSISAPTLWRWRSDEGKGFPKAKYIKGVFTSRGTRSAPGSIGNRTPPEPHRFSTPVLPRTREQTMKPRFFPALSRLRQSGFLSEFLSGGALMNTLEIAGERLPKRRGAETFNFEIEELRFTVFRSPPKYHRVSYPLSRKPPGPLLSDQEAKKDSKYAKTIYNEDSFAASQFKNAS
jgi:hypothetical protein